MSTKPFVLSVALPPLRESSPADVLRFLTVDIDQLRDQCRTAFALALDSLAERGLIKRFTEITSRRIWTHSSEFPEPCEPAPISLAPIDLGRGGNYEIDFVGYEVAIPADGKMTPPSDLGCYREPPPFLRVRPPWRLELYRASVRKLKTQDNLVFKVSVRISLPLFNRDAFAEPQRCNHLFRPMDIGSWQWRVLWECTECGYVCHCACFRRAVESDPFPSHMSGQWPTHLKLTPDQVPFKDGACELCRGLPSSHHFCATQYASSVFVAKYGAYLRKRLTELRLDGQDADDEKTIENQLRQELGLPPFGKAGFAEAELFRIVRAIFSHIEVFRRIRPDWLEGLELDIFVPSQSIAIEYHGPQHFAPVWPYGKEESFRQLQERDARKRAILSRNGIVLCVFSEQDEIDLTHVRLILERALKWKGTAT
jgi:hypothetical protein